MLVINLRQQIFTFPGKLYIFYLLKKINVCNIPIEKGKDGERELQREKRIKKRKRKRMRRYQEKKENGKIKWKERERIGR